MANPSGIPQIATPFLDAKGCVAEVWYRYLRRIGVAALTPADQPAQTDVPGTGSSDGQAALDAIGALPTYPQAILAAAAEPAQAPVAAPDAAARDMAEQAYQLAASVVQPQPILPPTNGLLSDLYANWTLANYDPANYPVGTQFFITDWNVLYSVQVVSAANTWVYETGAYFGVFAVRPGIGFNGAALGTNDTGLLFSETDTFYAVDRWSGSAWIMLPTAPYTQGDVTGSRAFGTIYQNTSRFPLHVSVIGSLTAGGVMTAVSDSGAAPTLEVSAGITALNPTAIGFVVLPGNYYQVTATALTVLTKWIEWA